MVGPPPSLALVEEILARPKSILAAMQWTSRHGDVVTGWLVAKLPVQFDDEAEAPEQFYVKCQWRKRHGAIPEHWTFNLIYQGHRIYAVHSQPTSIHENLVGKGRPYFGQEIGGLHEHIWSAEGDGYAEPMNLPVGEPEIMWKMFLKRAKIGGEPEFFHPDQNEPELDL